MIFMQNDHQIRVHHRKNDFIAKRTLKWRSIVMLL